MCHIHHTMFILNVLLSHARNKSPQNTHAQLLKLRMAQGCRSRNSRQSAAPSPYPPPRPPTTAFVPARRPGGNIHSIISKKGQQKLRTMPQPSHEHLAWLHPGPGKLSPELRATVRIYRVRIRDPASLNHTPQPRSLRQCHRTQLHKLRCSGKARKMRRPGSRITPGRHCPEHSQRKETRCILADNSAAPQAIYRHHHQI